MGGWVVNVSNDKTAIRKSPTKCPAIQRRDNCALLLYTYTSVQTSMYTYTDLYVTGAIQHVIFLT